TLGTDGTKSARGTAAKAEIAEILERMTSRTMLCNAEIEFDRCGCEKPMPGENSNAYRLRRCDEHDEKYQAAEAGRRRAAMRAEREQSSTASLIARGVLPEHADGRLEDFGDETEQAARAFLADDQEVGLLVKGPFGSGKTRLAAAVLREFWID